MVGAEAARRVRILKHAVAFLARQHVHAKGFPPGVVDEQQLIGFRICHIHEFGNIVHRSAQSLGHAGEVFAPAFIGFLGLSQGFLARGLPGGVDGKRDGQKNKRAGQQGQALLRHKHAALRILLGGAHDLIRKLEETFAGREQLVRRISAANLINLLPDLLPVLFHLRRQFQVSGIVQAGEAVFPFPGQKLLNNGVDLFH